MNPATAGNGNMASLVVDSRATVDALHAKALELGGSCEGPPGVRGDEGPGAFYGAYFRDPDGNKLAAFRIGPAD
jgi:predicted lactoylglutathione lyase